MDRRDFLLGGSAAVSFVLPTPVFSFENCGPVLVSDVPQAMDGLRNSFWFSLGPTNRRATAYVLMAPWCPFCRKMSADAFAGKLDFNIRVIPAEPSNFLDRQRIASATLRPSLKTAKNFFDRNSRPEISSIPSHQIDFVVNQQQMLLWNIRRFQAQYGQGFKIGLPSIMYPVGGNQGGFHAIQGYDLSLGKAVMEDIVPTHKLSSEALKTVNSIQNISRKTVRALPKFNRATTTTLPIPNSFPTYCADVGRRLRGVGTVSIKQVEYAVIDIGDDYYSFASEENFDFV